MGNLGRKAWEILSQKDNERTQVAFAIVVVFWISLVGAFAAFCFGYTARTGSLGPRFSGGAIATLACIGAFAVGGMLGLLFGSPTMGTSPPATTGQDARAPSNFGVRPNTSLERVADWLTTMIVGLGLVNLRPILNEATAMSVWLTQAITGTTTWNGTPGAAIALGFSFAGFALVYLWSMRFLPSELRASYETLVERVEKAEHDKQAAETARQQLEEEKNALLRDFKAKAVFTVPEWALNNMKNALEEALVPASTVGEIIGRYKSSSTADAEPMLEFGPAEDAGYKLSATVTEIGGGKFDVAIRVIAPDGVVDGKVLWLLHNSFSQDVLSVCPIDREYRSAVDEPFWIGAVVPRTEKPPVQLSMDLGTTPGAPPTFKTV